MSFSHRLFLFSNFFFNFFHADNIFFLLAGHKVHFMFLEWENITGLVLSRQ